MQHFKETIKLLETSSLYYMVTINMDSVYSYVSPSYDRNFDFSNESLLGKAFHITLHPDDTKICSEVAALCFENSGQLFPATLRKHDGKGGYVFTQWEFMAVFDENNNPDGIFCVGFNITEHVNSRTELDIAKTEIEGKNDKLTEIGLIQSHVIRKPLANIMGLSNILATMNLDTESQKVNDMLMDSANELDQVIKSIVDKTA